MAWKSVTFLTLGKPAKYVPHTDLFSGEYLITAIMKVSQSCSSYCRTLTWELVCPSAGPTRLFTCFLSSELTYLPVLRLYYLFRYANPICVNKQLKISSTAERQFHFFPFPFWYLLRDEGVKKAD